MSGRAPPKAAAMVLKPLEVAEFLRQQPDFLLQHPDILAALLIPAEAQTAENVRNIQTYLLQKAQQALKESTGREQDWLHRARRQAQAQERVQECMLRLLESDSFADFLQKIQTDLPQALHCDVALLALEKRHQQPEWLSEILPLKSGQVQALFGTRQALSASGAIDATLFTQAAGMVQSSCLLRLEGLESITQGVLILGSRDAQRFTEAEPTTPLFFLARVIARLLPRWLNAQG